MSMQPGQPGGVREVTTEVTLELDAPCGSCSHQMVCELKRSLDRARSADVVVTKFPDALTVVLHGTVECSFYDRARGAKRILSPAGKAALQTRAAAMRARKGAKAGAEA